MTHDLQLRNNYRQSRYCTIDGKVDQLSFLHNINHPLAGKATGYKSRQKANNQ